MKVIAKVEMPKHGIVLELNSIRDGHEFISIKRYGRTLIFDFMKDDIVICSDNDFGDITNRELDLLTNLGLKPMSITEYFNQWF